MNLEDLLAKPEGKTLEFKRDLSSPERVLRSIVAFANTAGGTLLVGIEDGTRIVRGLSEPLKEEERLASLVSDSIAPQLVPELEIVAWRDLNLLAVTVHTSSLRPHHVKREGAQAGVYVRVGSTNRHADPALIGEMMRSARGVCYDEQAMADLDATELDVTAAREAFRPHRELRDAELESLGMVVKHQGRVVPSIGGVLLYGKNRLQHFPDAWFQLGRFEGNTKDRITATQEARGHLVQAAVEAIAFVNARNARSVEIGAVQREEQWTIPPVAVREAIFNAAAHTDYSQRGAPIRVAMFDDRLEVENPGLLPAGLTIEDLMQGTSRLRNRVIGRVFHELKIIEQWGSGIGRINSACQQAGMPPPKFEELEARFRVTIFTERQGKPTLDETDSEIVRFVAAGKGRNRGRSTQEIADAIKLTPRATRTRLRKLVDLGVMAEIGSGPQDPQRRYIKVGR